MIYLLIWTFYSTCSNISIPWPWHIVLSHLCANLHVLSISLLHYFLHIILNSICSSLKITFILMSVSQSVELFTNSYLNILSAVAIPKGIVTAEEPPSLPIHTLPSNPLPLSATISCIYYFNQSFHLTAGHPLLLGPSISFIHFLHKLFTLRPKVFFSPIPQHHTTPLH